MVRLSSASPPFTRHDSDVTIAGFMVISTGVANDLSRKACLFADSFTLYNDLNVSATSISMPVSIYPIFALPNLSAPALHANCGSLPEVLIYKGISPCADARLGTLTSMVQITVNMMVIAKMPKGKEGKSTGFLPYFLLFFFAEIILAEK
jgi:hypothetical protein